MVEEKHRDKDVSESERQLIAALPAQGSIGNGALRNKLGWDEEHYWYVRNRLLLAGVLAAGRGRGGSVLRALPNTSLVAEPLSASAFRIPERDLYDPIVSTLRSPWIPDHPIDDFVIDCTAQQGRRDTGGKWTRPDVALASRKLFKFVPGIQLELNTFEIKTYDGLDVTAVYEALAHRRSAHYSYVLAYVPDSERAPLKRLLDRLCEDAGDHGVGIILAAQATDYKTWTFAVEPCRNTPEPADLNDFISSQTSEAFQERVLTWCRSW